MKNRQFKYTEMQQKKAVIFDMDGVLVDSEKYYIKRITELFAVKGKPLNERNLYPIIGADEQECIKYLCELLKERREQETLKQELTAYLQNSRPRYRELLFDDVRHTLENLYFKGYILAIASSSSVNAIRKMLKETELEGYFKVVVSGQDFPRSKPDPVIYNRTIYLLGLKKEECVIIEDSTYGIEAGKRAGVDVIAVNRENLGQRQDNADMIVDTLQKLEEILQ